MAILLNLITAQAHEVVAPSYGHPRISADAAWAGALVILILALFLAATVIGLAVRSEQDQELPEAHSHDEPPGASGHHGRSGTEQSEDDAHHH